MITPDQLRQIAPVITESKAQEIAPLLDSICPLYRIDTPNVFHEFIANVLHESACFTHLEENLYYTKAQRIKDVWPNRFRDVFDAAAYTKNPKKLAEKVYGKRADLGNYSMSDGWDFRGGGPIQLTGRANFTLFTNYYNSRFKSNYNIIEMADKVRTDLAIGIHSACWIFAVSMKLIDEAQNDYMKEIVKKINGGYNGIAERMKYYELAKQVIQ